MQANEFLKNLQKKPEEDKKRIIFITIIILSVLAVFVWLFISYSALQKLNRENIGDKINWGEIKKAIEPKE